MGDLEYLLASNSVVLFSAVLACKVQNVAHENADVTVSVRTCPQTGPCATSSVIASTTLEESVMNWAAAIVVEAGTTPGSRG